MLPPGSIGEAVLVTSIGTTVLVTSGDGIIAVLIGQVVLVSPIDTTVHKTSGGCRHCYGVNWASSACDINRYNSAHNIRGM